MLLRSIQRTRVEASWITLGQLYPGDQAVGSRYLDKYPPPVLNSVEKYKWWPTTLLRSIQVFKRPERGLLGSHRCNSPLVMKQTNKLSSSWLRVRTLVTKQTNKLSSSWSESLKSFLVLLNVVDDKYSGDTSDGLLEWNSYGDNMKQLKLKDFLEQNIGDWSHALASYIQLHRVFFFNWDPP